MTQTTTTPPVRDAEFPRPSRLRPKGTVKTGKRGRYRALVLLAVHLAALAHILYWLDAGESISPIEPSEAGETLSRGIVNAGFILLGLAIVSTLILGRWFCGWACHFVAYQDGCSWLLKKIGFTPTPLKSRLLVLVPLWAAYEVFFKNMIDGLLEDRPTPAWSLQLTKIDWWETFPGVWMGILTAVICGFLIVYWLGAKGFCTYGCPYGALFGIADRFSPMRIQVTDACGQCGQCTSVCTSNVQVHKEVAQFGAVFDSGCMKTMDCVSTCPNDALYYGSGRPALFKGRSKSRADLSWGEEILGAVVFVVSVLSLRGLYGRVPFLLAVGTSVLLAIFAIVLLRAIRQPSLGVQGRTWKTGGKLTTRGRVGLGVGVLTFLFVGHSGVVRWHAIQGLSTWEEVNEAAIESATTAEEYRAVFQERRDDLHSATEHLSTSLSLGLLPNAPVLRDLGTLEARLGELDGDPKRLDRAEALYRKALEAEEHWTTRVALATAIGRRGPERASEVEQILRNGLAEDPTRPQLTTGLTNLLMGQRRYDEAVAVAAPAFDRRPSIRVGTSLAYAQLETDQVEDAIQTMRAVDDLAQARPTEDGASELSQIYANLISALTNRGRFREANTLGTPAFERFPSIPLGLNLALAQLQSFESARALQTLFEVEELAKDSPDPERVRSIALAHAELENLLVRLGRFQEAVDFGGPLFERRPTVPLGTTLAFALSRFQRNDEALNVLNVALRQLEKAPDLAAGLNLVEAYKALGDVEGAQRVMGLLRVKFPNDPRLR